MERFALQELIQWNNSNRRKPLIVWGARQVGKTYLILELFAKRYYENSYIYIDFKKEDDIRAFCEKKANAAKIIEFLSLRFDKEINEKTLLVFDEAQECPNIISSLKYFQQDYPQIPVIATGTMVMNRLQRETHKRGQQEGGHFLFPVGKIKEMTVYPMTFDEYLVNRNKYLYQAIKTAYTKKESLDDAVHRMAIDEVYRYLLVGGMPEALNAYLEKDNILEARNILKVLYENYLSDMQLYQASQESILRSRLLFKNIYRELNRDSKNFSPSLIQEKTRTRDFLTSIEWLSLAHIINRSFQLKEHVTLPLMEETESNFRIYLADMGMFSYQSGINASSFLSTDRDTTLSGIFFENFVAEELTAREQNLFYWKGKSSNELEFLIESNGELYPIDVKKGRRGLNSINTFSDSNHFNFAIKISKNNYGFDNERKLMTIPFYFVPFLCEDLKEGKFLEGQFPLNEKA